MARVLVTGASGFLGGRIAEHLVAGGHEVRALVRPSSRRDRLKGVVPVEGDLQDEASLDRAMEGCEAVFHAAAVLGFWKGVEREQEEVNVLGTRRIAAAALRAGVRRLVHTSTIAAVGIPQEGSVADESAPFTAEAGRTAYARTKQAAEREVLEAVERGLDAVMVNPSVVYGVRPNLHYASNLFQDLAAGRVPAYPTGGSSWVWAEDAAAGHLLAWRRGRTGRRYILGAENLPYRDFMGAVCRAAGSRPPRVPVPGPVARLAAAVLEWHAVMNGRHPKLSSDMARLSSRHLYYDSGRARNELGWTPTPLEEASRRELYTPESERAIRDRQAALGEDATRPAVNAFFRKALQGRRFRSAADLGCNNGTFALEVLKPVSERLLLADFSEKSLEAARRKIPEARAFLLDLTKDPVEGRFDLVSLCEVIQHVPDAAAREAAFARAAALLEPEGILLYSGYFGRPGEPLDGLFRSDRWPELLFYHRSPEAENAARFARAGLEILERFREEKVEAFVLRKL